MYATEVAYFLFFFFCVEFYLLMSAAMLVRSFPVKNRKRMAHNVVDAGARRTCRTCSWRHRHRLPNTKCQRLGPIPAGSPWRGGDVTVYVCDINQPSLLIPFFVLFLYLFFFTALSILFQSTNSPDNSPFSHSVLSVFSLPYWSFQLYNIISLYENLFQPWYNP